MTDSVSVFGQNDLPAISAVVVIPDNFETVRATMDALQAQTIAARMEIVFVVPSHKVALPRALDDSFHSVQMVVAPILSIGRGYAAGICAARAPWVVLTEDHSFPETRWAEALLAAVQTHAVVAPAMRNGNPNSFVSWADFFIAYGKWAEPMVSQEMDFLPGHNSMYRRDVLIPYTKDLAEWFEAETVLQWELRRQGHTLWLEGCTYTAHLNFAQGRPFLCAQWYAGKNFAVQRARGWHWLKRALYVLAAPLIPFVRFRRVRCETLRAGFNFKFRVRLYAVIFAGLCADGLAQGMGYMGWGVAGKASLENEFHRRRYSNLPQDAA